MKTTRYRVVLVTVLLGTLAGFPAGALAQPLVEDFTTDTLCDHAYTTAFWNTADGQLRLPDFTFDEVGAYASNGFVSLAIDGKYAYVGGDQSTGFTILDVSNPENPVQVGNSEFGPNNRVVVKGQWAIAIGGQNFYVFDCSDPTAPNWVGGGDYSGADNFVSMAVSGNRAYVVEDRDPHNLVWIFDFSDPQNVVYHITDLLSVQGIAVAGNNLFLTRGSAGIQVCDITSPDSPVFVSSFDSVGDCYGIAIEGEYAYVAGGSAGLRVIDISDRMNLSQIATCSSGSHFTQVVVNGDMALLTGDAAANIDLVDISDPTSPSLLPDQISAGTTNDYAVGGEYAYVIDDDAGLSIVRFREATEVYSIGGLDPAYSAKHVAIDGDIAYVAALGSGLQTLDISDPAAPTSLGGVTFYQSARSVEVDGDLAYVISEDYLYVVDVSDPMAPSEIGSYLGNFDAWDLDVDGNLVYVSGSAMHMPVIDVTDPLLPVLRGSVAVMGSGFAIEVYGDHAYIAQGSQGVTIVDVSNPSNPSVAATVSTDNYSARGVAVGGRHLYVAALEGFEVFDVHDPSAPVSVADPPYAGAFTDACLQEKLLYLASYGGGCTVYDVSNPQSPRLRGTCTLGGSDENIVAVGDHAYIARGGSGLESILVCQQTYATRDDRARSTVVAAVADTQYIVGVQFGTVQNDSIRWWLSPDAGVHWTQVHSETMDIFNQGPFGNELMWRCELVYTGHMVIPTCDEIQLDWTTITQGGPPDLANCAVTTEAVQDVSVFTRPDGNGQPLSDSYIVNDPQYLMDATITVTLRDVGGNPCVGYPAEDIWLESSAGGFVACPGGACADHPVDVYSQTKFAQPLAGGGYTDIDEGEILVVMVGGEELDPTALAYIHVNSADISGDGAVNLTDITMFSDHFFGDYHYRCDFMPDGNINLSDIALLAQSIATTCDGGKSQPPIASGSELFLAADPRGSHPGLEVSVGEPFDLHLMLRSPDAAVGIRGWQANLTLPDNLEVLDWILAGDKSLNILEPPAFAVGLAEPLPGGEVVHLATARCRVREGRPVAIAVASEDAAFLTSGPEGPGRLLALDPGVAALRLDGADGLPRIPSVVALRGAAPNPFNPQTVIAFDLPRTTRVSLRVHDLRGRTVATLVDGALPAGRHEAVWQGRDGGGRQMASGVYLARLVADGRAETRKMLLMK